MNAPTDMSSVIVAKSDQLNADDLISGPRVITIRDVKISGGQEQPVSIYFNGDDGKPWRPCKTMSRVLVGAWGADAKAYIGRSLRLYRDPNVTWAGMKVGGIRISHMSDIEAELTMALMASNKKKAVATVKPLNASAAKPAADDPAAKWAAAYIANVQSKAGDALTAFVAEKAARLAELRTKRPDLVAEIDLALAEAGITISTATDEGSIVEAGSDTEEAEVAAVSEHEDRGEAVTLESAIAEVNAAETVIDINARVDSLAPLLSEADADQLRAAGVERVAALTKGQG